MSFKFRRTLERRDDLIAKYPGLLEKITTNNYVDVSWLIPPGLETESNCCSKYISDALMACTVMFPFNPPARVHLPTGTYLMGPPAIVSSGVSLSSAKPRRSYV